MRHNGIVFLLVMVMLCAGPLVFADETGEESVESTAVSPAEETNDENEKPERPKEALEAVFRICRLPMSAANYQKIANRISLSRCLDPAFLRLRDRLRIWFPPGT